MSVFEKHILDLATEVLAKARAAGLKVATAESCTGGLVVAALTEIPGSSDVVDRGFVTYTNEAKVQQLGVDEALIARHGAVSQQVAQAMATGALAHSPAHASVAVTGIAGPSGGTKTKPVGLVHIETARRDRTPLHREYRFGDIGRDAVRMKSVEAALNQLLLVL
jgi:nicotinamide-nucleotide amidase